MLMLCVSEQFLTGGIEDVKRNVGRAAAVGYQMRLQLGEGWRCCKGRSKIAEDRKTSSSGEETSWLEGAEARRGQRRTGSAERGVETQIRVRRGGGGGGRRQEDGEKGKKAKRSR